MSRLSFASMFNKITQVWSRCERTASYSEFTGIYIEWTYVDRNVIYKTYMWNSLEGHGLSLNPALRSWIAQEYCVLLSNNTFIIWYFIFHNCEVSESTRKWSMIFHTVVYFTCRYPRNPAHSHLPLKSVHLVLDGRRVSVLILMTLLLRISKTDWRYWSLCGAAIIIEN